MSAAPVDSTPDAATLLAAELEAALQQLAEERVGTEFHVSCRWMELIS